MNKPAKPAKLAQPAPPAHQAPSISHEMVLASLLEAVVAVDGDGLTVYVNQATESLLGASRRSLLGQSYHEVFSGAPWLCEAIDHMANAPESSLRTEGSLDGPNGAREIVSLVSDLRDLDGNPNGTVVMIHDLGRRRQLRTEDIARTRRQQLERLVASVAHELNNPLSGIRGAAQLLGKTLAGDSDTAEYTDMIVRQTDRMAGLIRSLMSLETPPPQMQPVNIHRVLNEVVLLEDAEAKQHGVVINHEFDPSLPEIVGDPGQLQQLFLNLVKNAIQACPATNGEVCISTRMETNFYVTTEHKRLRYISIDIRDNGNGIDDDTMAQMFTPLFSRTEGGHGLGLTIANNIATSHNGNIEVESCAGDGACFRVTLPVEGDSREASEHV